MNCNCVHYIQGTGNSRTLHSPRQASGSKQRDGVTHVMSRGETHSDSEYAVRAEMEQWWIDGLRGVGTVGSREGCQA